MSVQRRPLLICLLAGILIAALGTKHAHAENIQTRNAVYVELFGSGIFATANYEHHFWLSDKSRLAPRIGIGPSFLGGISVPVGMSFLHGTKHQFEAGVIADYFKGGGYFKKVHEIMLSAPLGYRFQTDGGFLLRITAMPLWVIRGERILPWGGISFGYAF